MKCILSAFLVLLMFKPSPAKAQDKITLPVESKIPTAYSNIDIILNLPDSNNIGFAPSDTVNYRRNFKPSQNISEWLHSFIDKQFQASKDSKAKKLLWVFHDLSIGSASSGNANNSFVKFKCDIYRNGDKGTYEFIGTFDSTWVSNNGKEKLGQMITTSFHQLYHYSSGKNNDRRPPSERYKKIIKSPYASKEEIAGETSLKQVPVLKNNTYKSGVYLSFTEFKNNTPSVNQFYTDVDKLTNNVSLYAILPDSSSVKIDNAWGLAVNNEIYFYSGKQLYPVEKWGNTFFISKYLDFRERKNQGLYWRRYIGAKQGDNNPFNDAHVLKRSVSVNRKTALEATHLDFDTEDFTY